MLGITLGIIGLTILILGSMLAVFVAATNDAEVE